MVVSANPDERAAAAEAGVACAPTAEDLAVAADALLAKACRP
jgi:hypothetical protein